MPLLKNLIKPKLTSTFFKFHCIRIRCQGQTTVTSSAFRHSHIRNPQRGGQNLSNRHVRLEQSLIGKTSLENRAEELRNLTSTVAGTSDKPANGTQRFRGLVIPVKPQEPSSDECCMSGCAICVYDLYDEALSAYDDAVGKVKTTLRSMNIPESEWPRTLRDTDNGKDSDSRRDGRQDVTLSVFEEMERQLKAQKSEPESPSGLGVGSRIESSS
ncbi:hypothetical protein E1B28_002823 [Marasmius oreades]|uniref:Oxidoreductase-like domain-containing protein n=1 Tax=Marasmius oreades TaxID=181124 RepID=A0A9P7RPG2_9AGAR|nr:uncharacterized protein E1B28_002823 [Marasmius oreades]KAG7086905.1 hypothetical protein E1B28_002823 [Marasmius oreades]